MREEEKKGREVTVDMGKGTGDRDRIESGKQTEVKTGEESR